MASAGPGRSCRPVRSGAPPPAAEAEGTGALSVSGSAPWPETRSGDALTSDYGRVATSTVMPRLPERPSYTPCRRNACSPSTGGVEGRKCQDVDRGSSGVARRCAPRSGAWIESSLRCMTALFCLVPRPRIGVGAPAGVDLFSDDLEMVPRKLGAVNSNGCSMRVGVSLSREPRPSECTARLLRGAVAESWVGPVVSRRGLTCGFV